jgi:hypothetical protein
MKTSCRALVYILIFAGCASNEIGNSKDVNPQTIFINYSILGEEGGDSVTCQAQFRFAGENGTTLVLNEPSKIQLDTLSLTVDSSNMMGAFYEKKFNPAAFSGDHLWKYTDGELKNYSTHFEFRPFSLKGQLPVSINRNDSLAIEITGLPDGAPVSAELSDTSSQTENLILKAEIANSTLILPSETWKKLAPGPISIHLSNCVDKPLPINERTAEGGRLFINYSLRERKIILKDETAGFAVKF